MTFNNKEYLNKCLKKARTKLSTYVVSGFDQTLIEHQQETILALLDAIQDMECTR